MSAASHSLITRWWMGEGVQCILHQKHKWWSGDIIPLIDSSCTVPINDHATGLLWFSLVPAYCFTFILCTVAQNRPPQRNAGMNLYIANCKSLHHASATHFERQVSVDVEFWKDWVAESHRYLTTQQHIMSFSEMPGQAPVKSTVLCLRRYTSSNCDRSLTNYHLVLLLISDDQECLKQFCSALSLSFLFCTFGFG